MRTQTRNLLIGSLLALASCGPEGEYAGQMCMAANESALAVCPGPTTVEGIDVSKYQATVNWSSVKGAGRVFGVARVSDGLNYPDAYFAGNWSGMKQAGVVRGVYQFFRAGQDPIRQADYMLNQLAQNGGLLDTDLPPILDIETIGVDGQSASTVQSKMRQWLEHVQQRTGRRPIIYTGAYMSSTIGTGFSSYPLWTANYTTGCPAVPNGWSTWKIWQYSSTGRVAGVSGNVDMNKFNGSRADLEAFIASTKLDGGTVPVRDAGQPRDAGSVPDAGQPPQVDAGPTEPDAGRQATDTPDSGHSMGTGMVPIPQCR